MAWNCHQIHEKREFLLGGNSYQVHFSLGHNLVTTLSRVPTFEYYRLNTSSASSQRPQPCFLESFQGLVKQGGGAVEAGQMGFLGHQAQFDERGACKQSFKSLF